MHAREVLDADHAGLEDVKDRIIEYLAVRKLRQERGIEEDKRSGAILTLIGPPGTGKTSIGESIARATGREFVRMSLGGVRDEAEIRGHRRTYIGALPGRLVRALRDAGTMNPVIMLDEVDKVGADWRGDPSARPCSRCSTRRRTTRSATTTSTSSSTCREVLFIATANVAETIPAPLLDRMEVIRFDGYTTDEKVAIARGYLWPRQLERNGLREDEVEHRRRRPAHDRDRVHARGGRAQPRARARQAAAQDGDQARRRARPRRRSRSTSTRVRDALGRQRFFQEAAERTAVPGVATGLAVTGAGGDVLFIEATVDAGQGRPRADRPARRRDEGVGADRALLRARPRRASSASTRTRFDDREFHVHVPAGAIPKDGPERGHHDDDGARVAAAAAARCKHTVGMTGEVTLQGRVLPIGGLKQKVLAAHAAGPDRRDPARAQPRRPRRRAGGRARGR